MAAFLVMEGVMVGVFSALDAVLFYVFWEAMLIRCSSSSGCWGGPIACTPPSSSSSTPFLGSVFMLVAPHLHVHPVGLLRGAGLPCLKLSLEEQVLIFVASCWPRGQGADVARPTWLPDAHVEAPPALGDPGLRSC